MGRPTSYTEAKGDEINALIAEGVKIAEVCEKAGIDKGTYYNWMNKHEDFFNASMRAREQGTHAYADQCIEIADDKTMDVADKRIMVDTRIRLIGKWNAKKYGDKQTTVHEGSVTTKSDMSHLSDEKLKQIQALMKG